MIYVWMVCAALIVAAVLTVRPKPPERHHIYWCSAAFITEGGVSIVGLPCMYRTNDPVDV